MPNVANSQADTQATYCATLVDEWARSGILHAVVCPGSRSTPMALALARGSLRVHVRLDERGAAFFAIGLALSCGRPVVVVTTSGTAAAELHAGVIEASAARVPLIVCTADRPPELQQVGAPQTIDQAHLFGRAVRHFVDPGVPDEAIRTTWRSLASRLVAEASDGPYGAGPVHLNMPFREPLLGTAGELPPGRAALPWHQVAPRRQAAYPDDLAAALDPTLRGVVVAGAGAGEGAGHLARRLGWPLLADPRSGLRRPQPGVVVVAAADAILRESNPLPEVVVRAGESWSSKVLATWLSATAEAGATHVSFDPEWAWRDPGRDVGVVVPDWLAADRPDQPADQPGDQPGDAAKPPAASEPTDWLAKWERAERAAQAAIKQALGDGLSEPAVARTLFASAQEGASIFVSSSMPVRDLEWFSAPRADPPAVFANRGANGIDGVVSSLFGMATDRGLTYGLVGDLAVLHDASALVRSQTSEGAAAVVVVLDNLGGGIFSFLPQATELATAEFELLFGTPQTPMVADLTAACGYPTRNISSMAALDEGLRWATEETTASQAPTFLVVQTDRQLNVQIHRHVEIAVGAAVKGILS